MMAELVFNDDLASSIFPSHYHHPTKNPSHQHALHQSDRRDCGSNNGSSSTRS
jgi:hypothetical protein